MKFTVVHNYDDDQTLPPQVSTIPHHVTEYVSNIDLAELSLV